MIYNRKDRHFSLRSIEHDLLITCLGWMAPAVCYALYRQRQADPAAGFRLFTYRVPPILLDFRRHRQHRTAFKRNLYSFFIDVLSLLK